jgi:hypothetical protein
MRLAAFVGSAIAVAAALGTAPTSTASVASFCDQIGGQWNGQYCHASVLSDRKAVREINIAIPAEIDNPVVGGAISDYLRTLMNNWRSVGQSMVYHSWGDANFEIFQHGSIKTVLFHEGYHTEGNALMDAYRTFAFDQASGRQVQLVDLLSPGNTLASIPPLAAPFIETALDQAAPPHDPGSYPFIPERWTPDKVYSGGYKAWALTPDELILYLPDYPVARDSPIDFTPGQYIWSMNGGNVQPHIPLSALAPILRPGLV